MGAIDNVAFMENPTEWPARPFLPLALEDGEDLVFGLLVEGQGATLFHANLVDALGQWGASDHEWTKPTRRWLARLSHDEFASMKAILDAGWEVD